jgi:transcription initiation factor IIF auxiliary subunit
MKKESTSKNPLRIEQAERYQGDDWWSWSVWLEGPKSELDKVKYVEYTLHPTFVDRVRKISSRGSKFKLSTGGWGVFPIYAQAVKRDGSVTRLRHQLKLHYPTGKLNRY